MITAFTIKNFKAIGNDPVRIELKPITLLFGANSAGKSSILHALNYAYSVFNDYNLNADYNTHSGSIFDLGGFERFIHREEKRENQEEKLENHNIVFRFDFDLKFDIDISEKFLSHSLEIAGQSGPEHVYDSIPMLDPLKILNDVRTAYVEVEISWSRSQELPYISSYKTGLNSEWIATICAGGYKKENVIREFNEAHPIFNDLWIEHGILIDWLIKTCIKSESYVHKFIDQYTMQDEKCKELPINRRRELEQLGRVPASDLALSYNLDIGLADQKDALPNLNKRLSFKEIWRNYYFDDPIPVGGPYFESNNDAIWDPQTEKKVLKKSPHYSQFLALVIAFEDLLNSVLVVPGHHVAKWLATICYLGPLREILTKPFIGDNLGDKLNRWRWEKGLAAWHELYQIGRVDSKLFSEINDWFSSDHRLNTGYCIHIERYLEIPCDLFTPILDLDKLGEGDFLSNMSIKLITDILHSQQKIRIWLYDKSRNIKLLPNEIGTGISQVLPVVVAAVSTDASLVAIEQPELHIHPALQVRLGDLFIENIKNGEKYKKSFLIETHSEHLLLRILRRINETYENRLPPDMKPCTPDDVAIYYLEKESQGLRIRRLEISEDGDSKGEWPEGFFEERRAELF